MGREGESRSRSRLDQEATRRPTPRKEQSFLESLQLTAKHAKLDFDNAFIRCSVARLEPILNEWKKDSKSTIGILTCCFSCFFFFFINKNDDNA